MEVKGAEHTFPLVDVFKKINKGLARCIVCHNEINYANKGSHGLLAHCKTELHKKKVYNITHSVAPSFLPESEASTSALQQGPENIRQRSQAKKNTPTVNRIANAEVGVGRPISSAQAVSLLGHKIYYLLFLFHHFCSRPWFLG
jgi:hypothetical protein